MQKDLLHRLLGPEAKSYDSYLQDQRRKHPKRQTVYQRGRGTSISVRLQAWKLTVGSLVWVWVGSLKTLENNSPEQCEAWRFSKKGTFPSSPFFSVQAASLLYLYLEWVEWFFATQFAGFFVSHPLTHLNFTSRLGGSNEVKMTHHN